MKVRTLHTVRLRIPPRWQSTVGESAPKGQAIAEPEGKRVNIPVLAGRETRGRSTELAAHCGICALKAEASDSIGKSVELGGSR